MNTPIHSPGRATTAIYRDARADDVPVMAEVFLMTVTEMFARNNVRTTPPPRQFVIDNYEHVLATGIFRVAELDGRVAGIAGAVVRDNLWFLSAFWVLPGYQNRNIGMPLLRQVWQAGVSSGAAIGFTWSSVDITAMAAYMKLGMRPGYPILMFEGEPDAFPSVPEPYRSEELQRSGGDRSADSRHGAGSGPPVLGGADGFGGPADRVCRSGCGLLLRQWRQRRPGGLDRAGTRDGGVDPGRPARRGSGVPDPSFGAGHQPRRLAVCHRERIASDRPGPSADDCAVWTHGAILAVWPIVLLTTGEKFVKDS